MNRKKVCLAGLPVETVYQNNHLTRQLAAYESEEAPLVTLEITEGDIAAERKNADGAYSSGYLEALAFYRKFCSWACDRDVLLFHSCAVETGGKAYLFAAPSGTGKSTHCTLWKSLLGDRMQVLNGDKPLIRLEDGVFYAYGTPFMGKEGWGYPGRAPIGGICFLARGAVPSIREITAPQALPLALQQLFRPKNNDGDRKAVAEMIRLLQSVPLWRLECDISEAAARLSYETMTGEKLEAVERQENP